MESRQAPAPIEPLVELRDVVKIHRDGAVRALDGVSLEIPAGQSLSIVGPGAQAYATTSPIWAAAGSNRSGPGGRRNGGVLDRLPQKPVVAGLHALRMRAAPRIGRQSADRTARPRSSAGGLAGDRLLVGHGSSPG